MKQSLENLALEIMTQLNELNRSHSWGFEADYCNVYSVICSHEHEHTLKVVVNTSYVPLTINADTFRVLSNILGTQSIDIIGHELVRSGCNTCNHGTEFKNEFVVYDANV